MSQSVKQIVVGSVAFLVLAILSLASAQNQLELASHEDSPSLESIQEVLRNVQLLLEVDNETTTLNDNAQCSCGGLKCKCCQRIRISKLKVNQDCCLSVTYLKRNYGILVTLKLGGRTLFSKEVSARNPPPICAGIPALKRGGSVCIQFYNLNIGGRSFSGCGRFLGRLLFVTVAKINLGCFRMNFLNATEPSETMELPYYDVPEAVENNKPLFFNSEVPMQKINPVLDDEN